MKWPLLVIWGIVGLPALIVLILDVVNNGDKIRDDLLLVSFAHCFFFLFWYVISKLEVHLNEDTIVFKNVLKTTTIYWSDITESAISFFFFGNGASIQWLFEYDLKFKERKVFDPAYYSKKGLREIASALVDKCPNARIAIEVWGMAKGRFPWYIFW